jgi:hypothetical protein
MKYIGLAWALSACEHLGVIPQSETKGEERRELNNIIDCIV